LPSPSKFSSVGVPVPDPVPVPVPGCPSAVFTKRTGRFAGLGLVIGLGAALDDVELAAVEYPVISLTGTPPVLFPGPAPDKNWEPVLGGVVPGEDTGLW
jgi:hypothetical protein